MHVLDSEAHQLGPCLMEGCGSGAAGREFEGLALSAQHGTTLKANLATVADYRVTGPVLWFDVSTCPFLLILLSSHRH